MIPQFTLLFNKENLFTEKKIGIFNYPPFNEQRCLLAQNGQADLAAKGPCPCIPRLLSSPEKLLIGPLSALLSDSPTANTGVQQYALNSPTDGKRKEEKKE